jgi:hypothetical protein
MSAENTVNPHFAMLVAQLQGAAWIHMGKVANPTTGEIDRNLDLAQQAIDMLGMLEEKTQGNLADDEERVLRELLRQLRLNYASEKSKPEEAPSEEEASQASKPAADSATGEGSGDESTPPGS